MKNSLLIILALIGVVGFTSCLKSLNDVNLSDIKGNKVFEVAPSEDPSLDANDRVRSSAFDILSTPQTLKIPIYLNTTSGTYNHDVVVTLVKDTAAINDYNMADTTGNTNYQFLPDSVYTTTTPLTVVVPAGQQFGYLVLNIISSKIDLLTQYMVSYKIVGVPTGALISDTRSSGQNIVAIKNPWDGKYLLNGYTLRAGDDSRTGYFNSVKRSLITTGVNTDAFSDLAPWSDGSGIGIGNPNLTINSDNSVTITSSGGASNDPNYKSYYDPSTKTFYISFTWGAGPSSRLSTDTLVYQGPR